MACVVFGDIRCALGVGRTINRIFGIRSLREDRIGLQRLRLRNGEETGIFEGPARWRVRHSYFEMLPEAVCEKPNPCLPAFVIAHEGFGHNGGFIAIPGVPRWKIPGLPKPTVSQSC